MTAALPYYIKAFTRLRRASNNGGAPHKPILLLSVLQLAAEGNIHRGQVFITQKTHQEQLLNEVESEMTGENTNSRFQFYDLLTSNPVAVNSSALSSSAVSLKNLPEPVAGLKS